MSDCCAEVTYDKSTSDRSGCRQYMIRTCHRIPLCGYIVHYRTSQTLPDTHDWLNKQTYTRTQLCSFLPPSPTVVCKSHYVLGSSVRGASRHASSWHDNVQWGYGWNDYVLEVVMSRWPIYKVTDNVTWLRKFKAMIPISLRHHYLNNRER